MTGSNFKPELEGMERLKASLTSGGQGVINQLNKEMKRATFDLVGYVKSQKLSGGVLNVRTGRLRRSITGKTSDGDGLITSEVGTNVSYGGFWERGYKGTEQVKAHNRKISQAFGVKIKNPHAIPVRAHSRSLDVKPRPFLEPSLQERYPTYQGWFAAGIDKGLRDGVK